MTRVCKTDDVRRNSKRTSVRSPDSTRAPYSLIQVPLVNMLV